MRVRIAIVCAHIECDGLSPGDFIGRLRSQLDDRAPNLAPRKPGSNGYSQTTRGAELMALAIAAENARRADDNDEGTGRGHCARIEREDC